MSLVPAMVRALLRLLTDYLYGLYSLYVKDPA
jgi:hypothetical protein